MGCGSSVQSIIPDQDANVTKAPNSRASKVDEFDKGRHGKFSVTSSEAPSKRHEMKGGSAWKLSPEQAVRLRAFFDKTSSSPSPSAIANDLGVFHEECGEIPMQLGLSSDVFVDRPRSSSTTLAECIPEGSPDNPLQFLQSSSLEDVAMWCQGVVASRLAESFLSLKNLLQAEEEASRLLEGASEPINDKFCVAEFGKLEEFHKGLLERIGYPMLNFYDGMQQEHCERADSRDTFRTPNYLLETSPAQEWRAVTEEEERVKACQGKRIVRSVEQLMGEEAVYPGEDEILYPPLSYLEVVGKPRVELVKYALEEGKVVQLLVRVVPTKISTNSSCSTIEDMISRRKNLYVAVMRNVEET
ncbi:hypothetical protein GUITHDRAFT_122574 [Guillardia theta CCMP2712]|uniref:Uncharacterized protein n=1 Tax=Guillardia theta (strain CCMP2712) TaxID=905079 RepID=L1I5R4_GUITC|nr:hypothetical protein GUITHDRAFT_122574 [Guillardia theta CCMP2712]EKX31219.1 hypothetical protein GUITHDRAFT_122574 [Guillardia theta CCMP2712]|eukprot:XP_005818199.1 hypothetical protein GUITHDRAFT_122574 [Guillardia theta CCMP2712]